MATQLRGMKILVEEADMDFVPNNSSRKGSNACQGEDPASSWVWDVTEAEEKCLDKSKNVWTNHLISGQNKLCLDKMNYVWTKWIMSGQIVNCKVIDLLMLKIEV